ncbi:hypothetical protein NBM05_08645 [Rothia sp. AR01]|uniref:Uroporphyrinogen-III synthase n=1 Tax=Rothia santali TaxID=2949643 RepID=A0A9X2KIQ4_9MICC|nr:hypothetical protein [Rothia santali]MCP3426069.1 hypothetical protein [Rothia santali]
MVCIGETTAARAAALGLPSVTAASPAPRDLLAAVREALAAAPAAGPPRPSDTTHIRQQKGSS